jgi:hypothetical protein
MNANRKRPSLRSTIASMEPFPEDEANVRLSLDVTASAADLLEKYADLRNRRAAAQGKRLRRQWTRKSIAELLLAAQIELLKQQMGADRGD